jgi:hypothetical protein
MYRILDGCPRCGHHPVHGSHARGLVEWLRRRLTKKRLFRCPACQWRGWANQAWDRRQRTDARGARLRRRADDPKPPDAVEPAPKAERRLR